MNCEIIRDLLPLYVDGVCSKETSRETEKHLSECSCCRKIYEDMKRDVPTQAVPVRKVPAEKAVYLRIRRQLGNMLLCAILFIALVFLAFGIMNEIGNRGWQQGLFAVAFVVPCAAFLLSMASIIVLAKISYRPWYPWVSAAITLSACIGGELYSLNHYRAEVPWQTLLPYCAAIVLIFTVLSFLIASLYSRFCRK